MGRKKKHEEEHVDETWLLPYSDMLTLLLALFIVMFAMSQVDNQKFMQVAKQLNAIFTGNTTILNDNGASQNPDIINNSSSTASQTNIIDQKASTAEQDQMQEMKAQLNQEIKAAGYADKIDVTLNGDGLNISIQDTVLFDTGRADVLNQFEPVLFQIANMIKNLDNEIRISGHTDNVPIYNYEFHSNWDLSYKRALNVMNFLVTSGNVAPDKFSIQAYGEYRPKYDNSTELGRAKNRSVDILVVRKYTSSTNNAN